MCTAKQSDEDIASCEISPKKWLPSPVAAARHPLSAVATFNRRANEATLRPASFVVRGLCRIEEKEGGRESEIVSDAWKQLTEPQQPLL